MIRPHPRPSPDRVAGFTLIETVLSMALGAIVLLAMTSAILLASHALPTAAEAETFNRTVDAGAALAQLTGDTRYALHFAELTPTAVTFSVPDRDGDRQPDRIRYHWSGVAGEPLYRAVNGGPDAVLIDSVDSLVFSTDTAPRTFTYAGADIRGSEVTLAYCRGAYGTDDAQVEYNRWYAQTVNPTLPADALRWQPSRVLFRLQRRSTDNGKLRFALHAAGGGQPAGNPLAGITFSESVLPDNYVWCQFTLYDAPTALPGETLAFVFSQIGGDNEAAEIEYTNSTASAPGFHHSTNGGGSWTYDSGHTLSHMVTGYYWTPGPTRTFTRYRHQRFAVACAVTGHPDAPLRSGCTLLTEPIAATRAWRLTFDEPDPTATDFNADGDADWAVHGGAAFATASVAGGAWNAGQRIDARPDCTFDAPTVVSLRVQTTTTTDEAGAAFAFHGDWTGSSHAGLHGRLFGHAAGQTFNLYADSSGGEVLLATTPGLPRGMVDVMLIFDPDHDEAALFVNDRHVGTFACTFESDPDDPRGVTIENIGGGGIFDEVRVVTGGIIQ